MAFCKPIENLQAYVVDVCIYTTFILEFCITNLTRKGYFCDLNYLYIRARLLSLAHLSTHAFFRKSFDTKSACDRAVRLR